MPVARREFNIPLKLNQRALLIYPHLNLFVKLSIISAVLVLEGVGVYAFCGVDERTQHYYCPKCSKSPYCCLDINGFCLMLCRQK